MCPTNGRKKVCENLGYLGVDLDKERNNRRDDGKVSTDESRVSVWRLKTDEESVVAACVLDFLKQ